MLDARKDWDVAGTQNLQVDQASLPWRELRDVILRVPSLHEDVRQALTLLEAWGGGVAADSSAAALFEFFLAALSHRIANAKAPKAAEWALGKSFAPTLPHNMFATRRIGHLVRLVREQPPGWFEQTWPEVLADALAVALRSLREQYGTDTAHWAWGQIRPLTLRHSVGERAPLHRVFNLGPFPWGGDANTVGQAAVDILNPAANPLFIASLRAVIDVGNWDESRFSLPGGQSGNPLSPHYDDLLPLWRRGKGVSIAWSPNNVERAGKAGLRLLPVPIDP
jgi:penicillin amidase